MIPRKLIRFHTLPSWTFELPEEPMIGLYFNFHSFEKAETAEIALVRFVVPVVPEAAITLHPIDWVLAMEVINHYSPLSYFRNVLFIGKLK